MEELKNITLAVCKYHSKSVFLIFILETVFISRLIWEVKND